MMMIVMNDDVDYNDDDNDVDDSDE